MIKASWRFNFVLKQGSIIRMQRYFAKNSHKGKLMVSLTANLIESSSLTIIITTNTIIISIMTIPIRKQIHQVPQQEK